MNTEGSRQGVEQEFLELQKRYKNIEQDRKSYNEETQANFKKQRTLIEKLQQENHQLKEELVTHHSVLNKNVQEAQQIKTASEEMKYMKESMREEEKKCNEMEIQIKILENDIIQEKVKLGGINATHESYKHIQKQVRILENRLDKANQKFNEAIAHNKNLREQIDSLRRERVIFDSIYHKLEKELHDKRKDMAEIIERANSAYEDRDKAQEKLASLIQQAEREKTEFEKEMTNINTLIDKDREMREFMKMKQDEKNQIQKLNLAASAEGELLNAKKQELMSNWGYAANKPAAKDFTKKIQYYEEAFAKIQAATSITEIDQLVENFIRYEEQVFFKLIFQL